MARYAYSTMLYLSLPPYKAIERLAELGLPIELSYDNFVVAGGKALEDKYIGEILTRANSDARVMVVHMPYDEMDPATALSEAGLKRFVKWLDLAHRLGAEAVVVHTLRIGSEYERALEVNVEFLGLILREAVDRGITLAVENRLEKSLFGSRPSDLLKIVNELGNEVRICLDVGHANINKNLDEFLSIGRRIAVIHAHDNDGYRDLHNPPYSGTVRWSLVENWISRTGFDGVIVFEAVCKDSVHICDSVTNYIRSTPIANI